LQGVATQLFVELLPSLGQVDDRTAAPRLVDLDRGQARLQRIDY